MGGMLEDVLLLGRVEESKQQFHPNPIDLPLVGQLVIDELLSATARRCPIHLELPGTLEGARGDESLLRHILANLLSNAVKYSPAGVPVTLRMEREARNVILRIVDLGRGIPAADRARLFQSFHRGSNAGDTPGTGLGLLIVKKCVEIHGGRVEVESQEGSGTTVTVVLPVFQPMEYETMGDSLGRSADSIR